MRPTRIVCFFVVVIASACGCTTKRLSRELAEERHKLVSENLGTLVTGGRITNIDWSEDGRFVTYTREQKRYRYDLHAKSMDEVQADASDQPRRSNRPGARQDRPARGRQRDRVISPDGEWIAVCKDWNVVLERAKPPAEANLQQMADGDRQPVVEAKVGDDPSVHPESPIQVTNDGHRKFRYGVASWVYGEELDQTEAMWWSPDSKKLVFYEFDERQVPDHFITADLTKLHTTVLTEGYPKPGEPNPIANLLIYDLETHETIRVKFPDEEEGEWYTYAVKFSPQRENGEQPVLLFNRTNRHQNVLHVCAADLSTGESRIIITETQETWQENSPTMRFLKDGDRFIWETERTGWKNYELRDLSGTHRATLTNGEYPVSSIVRVDEDAGVVFYTAYDPIPFDPLGPLHAHLFRVNLDGSDARRLTSENANHSGVFSPDGRFCILTIESVDRVPSTLLYDTDGKFIDVLATSNRERFEAMRMTMPEPFQFIAEDGTKLFGVLYKPSHFNPRHKYPLLIDVYGGPSSQAVRARFTPAVAACEYGFLIAKIDNRGTGNRGKAFESAVYQKLGDVDLKDQVDGVRFLTQRKYVDADRVGITGHSYGGYMSALALLKYPDVFHVAVAGGTVTDWRNYDTIYTERYMRTPQENEAGYDNGSCLTHAKDLKGKLLLIHGMQDDNVHPTNAWQLIDALQKANLGFDMMMYPDAGHSLGARAERVKWQFLRTHLLN